MSINRRAEQRAEAKSGDEKRNRTVAGSAELKGSRQILQESSSKLSSERGGEDDEEAMIAIEDSGQAAAAEEEAMEE